MPWNTKIDWGNENKIVNAQTGLPLDDLYGAASERVSTLRTPSPTDEVETNSPLTLSALRGRLVDAVNGQVIIINVPLPIVVARWGYIRSTGDDDYDYAGETSIDYWTMAKMETELGPEPEYYASGAPLTAAWLKWWHDAMNLLTHVSYPFESPYSTASFQDSERTTLGLINSTDYAAVIDVWENEAEWDSWTAGSAVARHVSFRAQPFNTLAILRTRYRMDPANRFSPYAYTNNYTLMSVLGFFAPSSGGFHYENNDYSAVTEGTLGEVYSDTSIQSGVYTEDISIGDFESVTVEAPPIDTFSSSQGWGATSYRHICRYDIEGGFEFVAPE